jgi:hypothetical protein
VRSRRSIGRRQTRRARAAQSQKARMECKMQRRTDRAQSRSDGGPWAWRDARRTKRNARSLAASTAARLYSLQQNVTGVAAAAVPFGVPPVGVHVIPVGETLPPTTVSAFTGFAVHVPVVMPSGGMF